MITASDTPEDTIGYKVEPTTRFEVRFAIHAGRDPVDATGVKRVKRLKTLVDCQHAYIAARDASSLGASQFSDGDIFDQHGQRIARISYNGRLWAPREWESGHKPIAEAPPRKARFDYENACSECGPTCEC